MTSNKKRWHIELFYLFSQCLKATVYFKIQKHIVFNWCHNGKYNDFLVSDYLNILHSSVRIRTFISAILVASSSAQAICSYSEPFAARQCHLCFWKDCSWICIPRLLQRRECTSNMCFPAYQISTYASGCRRLHNGSASSIPGWLPRWALPSWVPIL